MLLCGYSRAKRYSGIQGGRGSGGGGGSGDVCRNSKFTPLGGVLFPLISLRMDFGGVDVCSAPCIRTNQFCWAGGV